MTSQAAWESRSLVLVAARSLAGIWVGPQYSWAPAGAPAADNAAVARGRLGGAPGADDDPLGHLDVPERAADVRVLAHRAPDEADLAPERRGGVDALLHAADGGGERRHDDAPLAAAEDVEQVRARDLLGWREAGPVA